MLGGGCSGKADLINSLAKKSCLQHQLMMQCSNGVIVKCLMDMLLLACHQGSIQSQRQENQDGGRHEESSNGE